MAITGMAGRVARVENELVMVMVMAMVMVKRKMNLINGKINNTVKWMEMMKDYLR